VACGVDYPFSRSEKRLLLARLLEQERTAAVYEARRLRGLQLPWSARGTLTNSIANLRRCSGA